MKKLILAILTALLLLTSCSDYNIYKEEINICRVGDVYFDTLQAAVDYLANQRAISESRTIYLLKNVLRSEYSDKIRKGITVPSSFEGELKIDFGGYRYDFSSKEQYFFRFLGGSTIEVVNGTSVIHSDSISTESALIVGTRTVTIDEHLIKDLRSVKKAVEVTDEGKLLLKNTELSGSWIINGESEIRKGSYTFDSIKGSGDLKIYEGTLEVNHDSEAFINNAINSVPEDEKGDNARNEVGTVNEKYILILSGRVTKVSGSIDENTENGSFNVTIINPAENEYEVSNGKRFVSTFAQLKKALSDSATGTNTIILNKNISASETLNISGNVILDLNSNTITNNSNAKLFTISSGSSLTIKNGGISSTNNNVVEATGGSISFDNVSIAGSLDKVIDAKTNLTNISLANSAFSNVNYVIYSEKTNNLTISNCRFSNISNSAIKLIQKIDGNDISITSCEFLNSNVLNLSIELSETVTKGFNSLNISNNTFAGSGKKFVVLSSAISETLANNFSLTNTTLLLGATVNDLFEDQSNEELKYQYNSSTGEISK